MLIIINIIINQLSIYYIFYIINRDVLENGEFRLGLDSTSDCRHVDWNYAYPDTCRSLLVNITNDIMLKNSICVEACNYWTTGSGVCHVQIQDEESCFNLCLQQNWNNNYLDCIEKTVWESK